MSEINYSDDEVSQYSRLAVKRGLQRLLESIAREIEIAIKTNRPDEYVKGLDKSRDILLLHLRSWS